MQNDEAWVRRMADLEDQCKSISAGVPLPVAKPTKMYILILQDVPAGHAINSAAHASLACYLQFGHQADFRSWLALSFKKVTCKVTPEQLDEAQKRAGDCVIITESALDGAVMGAAFAPRSEWDPFFKTLSLWK